MAIFAYKISNYIFLMNEKYIMAKIVTDICGIWQYVSIGSGNGLWHIFKSLGLNQLTILVLYFSYVSDVVRPSVVGRILVPKLAKNNTKKHLVYHLVINFNVLSLIRLPYSIWLVKSHNISWHFVI